MHRGRIVVSAEQQHSRFAAIFAMGTFASRILGLVRDIIFLGVIPAATQNAFVVAWRFPNMLRELIGEGASNAALVPVFSEALETKGQEAFKESVAAVMGAMLLVLVTLTALGILVVPAILYASQGLDTFIATPRIDPEFVELTVWMSQWVFPYLLFIGMAVFAMGPLFAMKQFGVASWSPALLNVFFIACCLLYWLFPSPEWALVTAIWLGGIAQLVANYIAMGRSAGVWRPSFRFSDPAVKLVFFLLIPVLFGQAASEVNKLVDNLFAFRLGENIPRVLYAANRLVQLPLSMFGMATAVAILPTLARAGAKKEFHVIRQTLKSGFRQSYFLVFPSMIGLILLGEPIIRLLFERGQFGPLDTQQTTAALALYAAGLLSFAWVKVGVSGFYAVQNTRTPVIVASVSMVINILLNFVLVGPLGFRGLALATTLSFTLNFILIYIILWDRFGALADAEFGLAIARITVATFMALALAVALHYLLRNQFASDTFTIRLVLALLPIAIAVAGYFVFSTLMQVPEMGHLKAMLRRKAQ
jgi:putative peptidoglycan lipid II flippase